MIDQVMMLLRDELDAYIQGLEKPEPAKDFVALKPLLKKDGQIALDEGTLGLTLVNIEEERIHRQPGPIRTRDGNQVAYANPPIMLRLFFLVTAYDTPDNYAAALKLLSYAISFFNTHNLFTPDTQPAMNPQLEQLSLELHSLNMEQVNQLWGAMGAKYLPSVMYLAKLAPIDAKQITQLRPAVNELDFQGRNLSGDHS